MTTYLVDSNVLIYPFDARDPAKQERAGEVLGTLRDAGAAALSAQALSEFSSVALTKLAPPLPARAVREHVEALVATFPVHAVTAGVVREALRGVSRWKLFYYDAQVWAVAKLHSIDVVVSEDFASGSSIDGVRFLDPFTSDL